MSLSQLPQLLINGMLLGCIYAGFALGLSVILGVLKVVNLAHSAVLVLATLCYWELVNALGVDPLLSIVPIVVLFYFFGLALHRGVAQRLAREHDSTVLLAFFGIMVTIESIAVLIWTTDTRNVRLGYLGTVLRFWDLNIALSRVAAAVLIILVLTMIHLLLTRTLTGAAIRGLSENRDVASMVGIGVDRLTRQVFAAGTALAAFGGCILGLAMPFTPQGHVRWLAWAFLVVIIGGMGSVLNTLLAGLAIGLTESIVSVVLPTQYTYLILYAILAIALLVRRTGLGGVSERAV
jgi:branched-chain amino acid transport system permease protein